jgi:hypothetical protein
MKKNLLQILAVFCCSSVVLAQPTLTSSGLNPVSGETLAIKYANYVSPGNAGANQTWNLSSMTASSTSNYTAGSVSSTPYAANFSSANIQMNDGNVYSFMNNSSTAMVNVGIANNSSSVVIPYSNGEDLMHYPFNMNDTYTDTWAATYVISSLTFNRTGTTTVTYDGYGTLTTPAGTFNNVARIHFVQDYSDVSSFGTIYTHNDEYIWMANGYHSGLASVFTLSTSVSAPTQSGTYIQAGSIPTSLQEWNAANTTVMVYPNPANDRVSISSAEKINTIDVYDLKGELILSESVASTQTNLDLSDLNAGIYLAKINMVNGDVQTKKITLNK